jgi:hypothetical protein
VKKLQLILAAVAAVTCIDDASASIVGNVASGSVAVVGAGGSTGQVFPNIILDAANNRSDYLVFNLSSFAGQTIGGATLTLTQPGFYTSTDSSENFSLWDFTGNVNALASYSYPSVQPTGAVAASVRDDLRSGVSYGSVDIAKPDSGIQLSSISVALNASALADINSAISSGQSLFAIGGFSNTLTGSQLLFSNSGAGPNIAQLDLQPVPLPAAVWLFGSGMVALGGAFRRRTKAAA